MNSTGDQSLYKPFVGIAVLAESRRDAATLVRAVRNTPLARVVFFCRILPQTMLSGSVIKDIQESPTRIALVAVGTKNPQPGINAISQLYASTALISVVGYGGPVNQSTIVAAMRAGARDFITRDTGPRELTEAFQRLLATMIRVRLLFHHHQLHHLRADHFPLTHLLEYANRRGLKLSRLRK